MISRFKKYKFLFAVLVNRDFKKKYNRTVLGAFWSLLSPLFMVTVQALVFTHFFGRTQKYFVVYMFIGNLIYSFFTEATKGGMAAIEGNAGIITKVRVPKYLFVFSKNITALINCGLTFLLLIVFCIAYKVPFTFADLLVLYPVICLTVLNIGAGLFLSGVFVFFRDTRYFYDIFCVIVMYFSAIFYTVDTFPEKVKYLFYLNPIFCYISYIRKLVLYGELPSIQHSLLCAGYAVLMLGLGCLMYMKNNKRYVYNL